MKLTALIKGWRALVRACASYEDKMATYNCIAGLLRSDAQHLKRTEFPDQGSHWRRQHHLRLLEEFSAGNLYDEDAETTYLACRRIGRDIGACRYELMKLLLDERNEGTALEAMAETYGQSEAEVKRAMDPLHARSSKPVAARKPASARKPAHKLAVRKVVRR
jgi:hypothetical protein